MILSSFSHYSIIHMVANMYVLWTFSSGIVSLLGKEQFLAVYLSAGMFKCISPKIVQHKGICYCKHIFNNFVQLLSVISSQVFCLDFHFADTLFSRI